MRILLFAVLLATGIAIGAAVPAVARFVQDNLAAAGLPKDLFTITVPPITANHEPSKAGTPPDGDDDVKKPGTPKATNGHEIGKHGYEPGEEHPEKGAIRMGPEEVAALNISVVKVEGGTLARHLLVPGAITPDTDRIARVPARVVGTVTEMRKRLGDRVARDEIVAVLESRDVADAKSEYLIASVRAELEKTNFDRQQALWDKRISSEQVYLRTRATYTEATLRVDLASQKLSALGLSATDVAAAQKREGATLNQSTLRRYELRSSLAGRVVERKVEVGTTVGGKGDPADIYTVADLSTVWIELSVPTHELAMVREGAPVAVTHAHEAGGRHADGKVVFVSPFLNPDTRSARVIVALPNPDLAWRPGAFVTAGVEIANDAVEVHVPKAALQTVGGERVVFVRTEEGFEKREVELGRSDDDSYEVVSGLKSGATIAVANSFILKAELRKSEAGDD